MTVRLPAPGRKVGDLVRIRKVPYIVGPMTESGQRRFTPQAGGEEMLLNPGAIERLERQHLITAWTALDILSLSQVEAMGIDWGSFNENEQASAYKKHAYVTKLDELDVRDRNSQRKILEVIEAVYPLQDYPH